MLDKHAACTTIKPVKKLIQLMQTKKSNLVVSADLTQTKDILNLAKQIAPHTVMLKLHADIINDFSKDFIHTLKQLGENEGFLLFEDRKFADIGHTAQQQLSGGLHRIADWADFVTVHALLGKHLIEALEPIAQSSDMALLLLSDLSQAGQLIDDTYRHKAYELANQYPKSIGGIIAQKKPPQCRPGCLTFTPGVHLHAQGDALGQTYRTPQTILKETGSDLIIVGRAIYQAENPALAAAQYQSAFAPQKMG